MDGIGSTKRRRDADGIEIWNLVQTMGQNEVVWRCGKHDLTINGSFTGCAMVSSRDNLVIPNPLTEKTRRAERNASQCFAREKISHGYIRCAEANDERDSPDLNP
jgi:hypothetical protein